MLNQLLAITPEVIESGSLTFILGLLVTFFGIAIIVVFVTIAGSIFNKGAKEPKEPKVKVEKVEVKKESVKVEAQSDDIPDTVKAAIIAAISAYYFTGEQAKSNCEFVVKRIKRI